MRPMKQQFKYLKDMTPGICDRQECKKRGIVVKFMTFGPVLLCADHWKEEKGL